MTARTVPSWAHYLTDSTIDDEALSKRARTAVGLVRVGSMAHRGMPLVDTHVHLLPGRLGTKVRAVFEAGGAGPLLVYPADHAVVLDRLAAEGVDRVWSLPYAHKPGVAAGLNDASAATAAEFSAGPVAVTGGCTVHPGDEDPVGIVRHAVDLLGLRVLKLHCSVGSFALDDPRLDPVLAFSAERRLPVVIHLGHGTHGRTAVEELPPLDRVASRHPTAPLVVAHAGHAAARATMALLDRHRELHVDLTPVVAERPDLDAEHVAAHPGRVLFGSDAPNTGRTVTQGLDWLDTMGLPEAALAAILGGNADRLTGAVLAEP